MRHTVGLDVLCTACFLCHFSLKIPLKLSKNSGVWSFLISAYIDGTSTPLFPLIEADFKM